MADGPGPSDKKRAPTSRESSRDGEKPKAAQPKPENKYSSGESSEEEEDTRELEGNVYTKNGVEISRRSAGNVKRTKEEIAADPEEEDEFGYTEMKIRKKYANLKKRVFVSKLEKGRSGMGISLAGHKDRNKMAVFICGIDPSGTAAKEGILQPGDEILEVNGTVFQGRCHLNVTSMIKGMPFTSFKFIVVRRPDAIQSCAVPQVTVFPTPLPGEDYSQFKGVHLVPIKKGTYGLGIMIIEGKHAEVGHGIFVSDVQEGGAAEQIKLENSALPWLKGLFEMTYEHKPS
ncbi:inactivation-no-after-potential D protein-like [Copidosoma floridanum]|uniref:inactivation-no-after-potential D protein-like n=1 Tax=Copidosoma floridanum TaxID=29053 RepID=UPI000C6F9A91|nr:inactivation-no-after-potential D protein-like [Copidosoma floridanum]